MSKLKIMLIKDENLRLFPYTDSVGKLTIGVGRNLDDNGISKEEAYNMLDNDIARCRKNLSEYAWYEKLNVNRQNALLDMLFNLGLTRFLRFKKMIAALEATDYEKAADEMLDSKWAKQVGERAEELAIMMLKG